MLHHFNYYASVLIPASKNGLRALQLLQNWMIFVDSTIPVLWILHFFIILSVQGIVARFVLASTFYWSIACYWRVLKILIGIQRGAMARAVVKRRTGEKRMALSKKWLLKKAVRSELSQESYCEIHIIIIVFYFLTTVFIIIHKQGVSPKPHIRFKF